VEHPEACRYRIRTAPAPANSHNQQYRRGQPGPRRRGSPFSVNLSTFRFHSKSGRLPHLNHFTFPNLVSFDFSVTPMVWFCFSTLLDFLEASPMLQTVRVTIAAGKLLLVVPERRIAVLPNVKTITLVMGHDRNVSRLSYAIAAHLSCPSARPTSFVHIGDTTHQALPRKYFPLLTNGVKLSPSRQDVQSRKLHSRLRLSFPPHTNPLSGPPMQPSSNCISKLPYVKTKSRLTCPPKRFIAKSLLRQFGLSGVTQNGKTSNAITSTIVSILLARHRSRYSERKQEILQFFGSPRRVEDLQPYIYPFLDCPEDYIEELFPPTEVLEISHPHYFTEEDCLAIVKLAKSQHVLEKRFERVIIRAEVVPVWMEQRLELWVGSVERFREPGDD
jgi:hypothetical protein